MLLLSESVILAVIGVTQVGSFDMWVSAREVVSPGTSILNLKLPLHSISLLECPCRESLWSIIGTLRPRLYGEYHILQNTSGINGNENMVNSVS